jgi:hypothetical protein
MKLKMKELGDIGNVIAAVGVIISLLVVAWQIRGNTAAVRAEANLGMISLGNESFSWLKDPEFAALLIRMDDETQTVDTRDFLQFQAYGLGFFNLWEQGYLLHEQGLMLDPNWIAWNEGLLAGTEGPAIRQLWESSKAFYSPGFRAHIDREFGGHPVEAY